MFQLIHLNNLKHIISKNLEDYSKIYAQQLQQIFLFLTSKDFFFINKDYPTY